MCPWVLLLLPRQQFDGLPSGGRRPGLMDVNAKVLQRLVALLADDSAAFQRPWSPDEKQASVRCSLAHRVASW